MAYGTVNVDAMTTSDGYTSAGTYGFKNRLINSAMVIDQRNAGASVTPANGDYTLDRWRAGLSVASKYSVQQNAGSVTPPVGFSNYLGITSLSAYTVGADDYFIMQQPIEGFNFSDLQYGTANAKTATISFWVRSSLTGTFGGSFTNSNYDYGYPFTYTISSANTWEQKSVTIVGPTSGTWVGSTNGIGLRLLIGLGVGSNRSFTAGSWQSGNVQAATGATSVVGTNGATFYITGVQLEKGSTATSFDYRPYGTELALCQRYCQVTRGSDGSSNSYVRIGFGSAKSTTVGDFQYKVITTFRAVPSLTVSGDFAVFDGSTVTSCTGTPTIDAASAPYMPLVNYAVASGLTQFRPYAYLINNSSTTIFVLSAEL